MGLKTLIAHNLILLFIIVILVLQIRELNERLIAWEQCVTVEEVQLMVSTLQQAIDVVQRADSRYWAIHDRLYQLLEYTRVPTTMGKIYSVDVIERLKKFEELLVLIIDEDTEEYQ